MAVNVSNRKPNFKNIRSHALNATKKKQGLNTQKVTVNGKTIVTTAREAKKIRKESNLSQTELAEKSGNKQQVISRIEKYPYRSAPKSTKRFNAPNDYGPKILILDNIDTKTGKIIPGNGEFIHGTNKPSSVGQNQSKGCVRMHNDDIEKLASWVSKGQYVLVRE